MPASVRWRVIKPQVRFYRSEILQAQRNMQAWGEQVRNEVREYPPPAAGSYYQRTNQFYNAWVVAAYNSVRGYTVEVLNFARNPYTGRPYMQYVTGGMARGQRPLFTLIGWLPMTTVVKAASVELMRVLAANFRAAFQITQR